MLWPIRGRVAGLGLGSSFLGIDPAPDHPMGGQGGGRGGQGRPGEARGGADIRVEENGSGRGFLEEVVRVRRRSGSKLDTVTTASSSTRVRVRARIRF